jgi:DNA-binding response OmpR family regulator
VTVCVERLLIVDDSPALLRSLSEALAHRARHVETAASISSARALLRAFEPELLLLDVALPDGNAFDLLTDFDGSKRTPAVIALSGAAGPAEGFRLAAIGVREYLQKPVTAAALTAAVDRALNQPPDLRPHLRALVGHRPLKELEAEVRDVMVDEALIRARGSRRGAATLLSLSRQLLQHILRNRP